MSCRLPCLSLSQPNNRLILWLPSDARLMPRLNFRRWRAQKSSIKSCLIQLAENVGFVNDSNDLTLGLLFYLFLDWLLLWPRGPVSVIPATHSQMSSKADHSASSGMFPSIRLPSFIWNSHRNFLQYCSFRRYFFTKITAQPAVQYCKHEALALSVPKKLPPFWSYHPPSSSSN